MKVSGKVVIVGILAVALLSAAASWWFRYAATNQAARFWGPQTTRLIREAPVVELYEYGREPNADYQKLTSGRDLSQTPGLLHLRNALLEDKSFNWPAEHVVPGSLGWALVFRDPLANDAATLRFTSDWRFVGTPNRDEYMLSCEPIASGLQRFINDVGTSSAPVGR